MLLCKYHTLIHYLLCFNVYVIKYKYETLVIPVPATGGSADTSFSPYAEIFSSIHV